MKHGFVIICSLISVINWIYPLGFGYSGDTAIYSHISYIFVHANAMHLVLNMYVFWVLYDAVKALFRDAFLFSFLVAVASSFIYQPDKITMGSSGVVYGLIGCAFALRELPTKSKVFNAISIVSVSLVGLISGHSNVPLHLICLFTTFIISKKIQYDFKKVS